MKELRAEYAWEATTEADDERTKGWVRLRGDYREQSMSCRLSTETTWHESKLERRVETQQYNTSSSARTRTTYVQSTNADSAHNTSMLPPREYRPNHSVTVARQLTYWVSGSRPLSRLDRTVHLPACPPGSFHQLHTCQHTATVTITVMKGISTTLV